MNRIKSSLIILVLLLYFLTVFIDSETIYTWLSILAFLLLIVAIPSSKAMTKVMGISLLVIGLGISIFMNGSTLIESVQGIQLNLPLLILILLAPLLSIPLKSGTLLNAPMAYIEQVKDKPGQLFLGISSFLALLAPVLNVGSVRILADLMKDRKLSGELLGRSYFTGFSTAMVWSPYFGSVALVLYYLDIPYSEYVIIGLLFAAAQLLTGNLLFALKNGVEETMPGEKDQVAEKIHILPLVLKFVVSLGILISALIFLEQATKLPMIVLVSMLAIIIPTIWMALAGKWKSFVDQVIIYKNQVTGGNGTEMVLFLSAGIFGSAISNSSISDWIKRFLLLISEGSFIFFVIFIVFTIMFFALIGFHQIITVPLLVMQVDPAAIGMPPVAIAFVFILAWFMSAIISPINAVTILISNAVSKKFFTVGFRWNGLYVLSMFLIGCVFIYALQAIYR
ncbi:hypothetical protein FQV26_01570 [Planococcus sp. CPCC 101016]|uniref:hypothetical protein n=1 Tax=Planococcus sp. CPCC 101016 TaxID=2599617 RepID=UPI0011B5C2DF|nr:hypothetical protein [Planococcus sp. CPCC 101016]TWT06526.1 hypothetical protein FQV26_01570 [Planococcus sp. CPCC 101016]